MRITIIFLLLFNYSFSQELPINITNSNFRILAMNQQVMTYGFVKGDKVIINYSEERGKKLKIFTLSALKGNTLHSEFNLVTLKNKEIIIKNTGIYVFKFINSSLARRIINFKVDRVPATKETIEFNTEVKQRIVTDTTYTTRIESYVKSESYKVVNVASKQEFYVNSGSNALLKGGKSRVTIPINLPKNTVKWYYQVSSFRDKTIIEKVSNQMNLVSDLSKLFDSSGSIETSLKLLSNPPGANYCDIYLIDANNYSNFLSKKPFSHYPIGTRENIKSANVEITTNFNQLMYLGIKNPDRFYGVNVIIKIAAIVLNKEMATRKIKVPHITTRKELYLDNN